MSPAEDGKGSPPEPASQGPLRDPSPAPSARQPAPPSSGGAGASPLADVRGELRRLGYLDHQVERFLLQDALRPERPWRAAGHLAVKVGLLIGLPTALLATLVLAGVEGHLMHSPFDVLPLFLHLLVPSGLLISLGFLGLALLLAALLRFWHVRRIEAASFGLALASAALSVAAVLAVGRAYLAVLGRWQATVLALAVPVLAWLVWKAVHGGLLTLAIRLTDQTPERPSQRGRWGVLALLALTFLVMLSAALDVGRSEPGTPANLPVSGSAGVAVIGVDGVLPAEVEYLVGRGEMGALEELEPTGVWLDYSRREEEPIAFWASMATGLASPFHGMGSVDTFRPLGVSRPLRRSGWARPYWSVLARLGLAEYRPVLANNRSAWAFWELASRGGAPSLVVNWWGTFPAEPAPGAIVAHGAYQLLGSGSAEGAVHPAEWGRELTGHLDRGRGSTGLPTELLRGLEQGLGTSAVETLVEQALAPDVFYRRLFLDPRAAQWPLRAVYLPALDIASASAGLDSVFLADLIRWQLGAVDALVANLPEGVETLLLVLDPGRRGGGRGRAFLWRRQGCGTGPPAGPAPPDGSAVARSVPAEQLASALLRALGLPQSAELPPPPAICPWPDPSLVVPSYGQRRPPEPAVEGREYLLSLQSLGYL
ncbi:MAG: alkaline phosphatase family protein [Holophagales bacterium]|nr:alkaline phosphatase family protein [Holophagales bacterium]